MFDVNLILKDAGLVAASAAATVGGAAKVLDVGPALVNGLLVLDVSALELASNDELYLVRLQGSSKADFSSDYEDLMAVEFGAAEVTAGDKDSALGRYEKPFTNAHGGQVYRYLRLFTTVSGTVASGINYKAHLVK